MHHVSVSLTDLQAIFSDPPRHGVVRCPIAVAVYIRPTARCFNGQIEGAGNIMNLHGGAQLPSHDIAGEVIKDSWQEKPIPDNDLEICEVGLPVARQAMFTPLRGASHWGVLSGSGLIVSFHNDEGCRCDQVMGFQKVIGSVRKSVYLAWPCGFRLDHALKRSSNMIANWFLAANHSLTFLPPFSKLRMAK